MAVAYTLFVEAVVHSGREKLPGHIRQRIRRAIEIARTGSKAFRQSRA